MDKYNLVESSKLLGIKLRVLRYWIEYEKIKAIKHANHRRWHITQAEIIRKLLGLLRFVEK